MRYAEFKALKKTAEAGDRRVSEAGGYDQLAQQPGFIDKYMKSPSASEVGWHLAGAAGGGLLGYLMSNVLHKKPSRRLRLLYSLLGAAGGAGGVQAWMRSRVGVPDEFRGTRSDWERASSSEVLDDSNTFTPEGKAEQIADDNKAKEAAKGKEWSWKPGKWTAIGGAGGLVGGGLVSAKDLYTVHRNNRTMEQADTRALDRANTELSRATAERTTAEGEVQRTRTALNTARTEQDTADRAEGSRQGGSIERNGLSGIDIGETESRLRREQAALDQATNKLNQAQNRATRADAAVNDRNAELATANSELQAARNSGDKKRIQAATSRVKDCTDKLNEANAQKTKADTALSTAKADHSTAESTVKTTAGQLDTFRRDAVRARGTDKTDAANYTVDARNRQRRVDDAKSEYDKAVRTLEDAKSREQAKSDAVSTVEATNDRNRATRERDARKANTRAAYRAAKWTLGGTALGYLADIGHRYGSRKFGDNGTVEVPDSSSYRTIEDIKDIYR